ncbi:flagellin N-terminal helical domain-containing protein [Gluconobacter cerinus]|uniref:flagellin N-terminal helical domain-containing protein n=1 Tax=Gluconobacter cerinus TaxID=38307 RepID=UPI002013533F|nr:flagellin [Gluconobacter cerinus]
MSINTNTAAMSALQVLNQTTDQLSKTQNAVSTGKSVSSASDSPAIYAISQTMNSQISALSGVSTGLQFAGQVLSTASSQAGSISTVLSNISETVTNAANNGENQDTLNTQLSSYLSQVDVATSNSTFQGVNLLSGSTSSSVKYTQISAAQDINGNLFTLNGADATSTGLGLQGLSTDMKGATIDATAMSITGTGDSTTATSLTLKNLSAASASSATAANPAITTSFVMDSQPGSSAKGASSAVGSAISNALTTAATVTVGSNGALSIDGATSKSQSDGTTVYTLKNGDSISAKADASGNMAYSVTKAADLDANGNAKAMTNIVDVNISGARTDSSTNTKADQLSTLVTAIGNAGFGAELENDGTLTVAGGNLDSSSVNLSNGSAATTTLSVPSSAAYVDGHTALTATDSTGNVTNYVASAGSPLSSNAASAMTDSINAILGATDSDHKISIGADGTLNSATTATAGYTVTGSAGSYTVTNTTTNQTTKFDAVTSTDGTEASYTASLATATGLTNSSGKLTGVAQGTTLTLGDGIVGASIQKPVSIASTTGTNVVQLAVTGAINKMSRISSSIGVASNTVTQLQTSNSTLSDALTTGVGALTDADLAAESAKLTSLQTKQQLAIQSLSIANSQSSNIMSLFRG